MTDCPPAEDRQSPGRRSPDELFGSGLLDHSDTATRTATTTASAIQPNPPAGTAGARRRRRSRTPPTGRCRQPCARTPRRPQPPRPAGAAGRRRATARATWSAGTPPGPISNARHRGCSSGAVIVPGCHQRRQLTNAGCRLTRRTASPVADVEHVALDVAQRGPGRSELREVRDVGGAGGQRPLDVRPPIGRRQIDVDPVLPDPRLRHPDEHPDRLQRSGSSGPARRGRWWRTRGWLRGRPRAPARPPRTGRAVPRRRRRR